MEPLSGSVNRPTNHLIKAALGYINKTSITNNNSVSAVRKENGTAEKYLGNQ